MRAVRHRIATRPTQREHARHRRLMNFVGSDMSDWQWLSCFSILQDKVYIFHPDSSSVTLAGSTSEIPWQALWFLTRYHKKHRFNRRFPNSLDKVLPFLKSFEAKVRWAYKFQDHPGNMPAIRVKGRFTIDCPSTDCPSLEEWLRGFRSAFLAGYNSSMKRSRASDLSNVSPLAQVGYRMLMSSDMAAIPTDKDGGYTLIQRGELANVHSQILESNSYRRVHSVDWSSVARAYTRLAYSVGSHYNDRRLGSTLSKSLYIEDATFISTLKTTCKTHKPPGAVGFRNIHSSSGWKLQGLSLWLAQELKALLLRTGATHILKDSADFVEKLSRVPLHTSQEVAKVDVKDFFMSGSPDELLTPILESLPTSSTQELRYRNLLKEVAEFLLENQYISSRVLGDDRVYLVTRGTGMGLIHSGELADVSLYLKAERPWATDAQVMERHYVNTLFRFKDDILVFLNDLRGWRKYFEGYSDRAGCFKLEVEDINDQRVTFLDLEVYKGQASWKARPFIKPTNLGIPLSTSSSHPRSIHLSWPKGVLRRLATLCDSQGDMDKVHRIFTERLHQFFHHPKVVIQVSAMELQPSRARTRRGNMVGTREKTPMWCVIPYHPAFMPTLARRLHEYFSSMVPKALLARAFSNARGFRICWANNMPSHATLASLE